MNFNVRFGSRALSVFAISGMLLLPATPGNTQSTSRDRISREVNSSSTATVKGTARPLTRGELDQGRLSPEQQLGNLHLSFRLSSAQQADLQQLLRDQQNPRSPHYHKWLTPAQYSSRFGMTANDLSKVSSWLQSQGLEVHGASRNRNEISFTGSVGQVEYALKTEIHKYAIRGQERFANATDISLPAAFAGSVIGVRGLNNFQPRPHYRQPSARFTSNLSGNHFLIPGDFAVIYHVPSNLDGTGQTIAVVGQTSVNTSDLDAFRSASGLPATNSTNFQTMLVPGTGTATSCSGDLTEADLDLEWSEAVAKNATIKYVFAGLGSGTGNTCTNRNSNVFDALQYAIENNVAPIISISYGNCEANLGSFALTMQQWAQQANAQGQTITSASGDAGGADCDTGNSATKGLAVDVPASVPEVTGVGGTEFTGDSSACASGTCGSAGAPADQYWSGSNSLTSGASALQYIPEKAWNDTTQSLAQNPPGGLDAGGGGASSVFGKPSWQTGTGVPADGKRDVPDIALNASNAHDPYLFCTGGSCTNGFRDSANNLSAVGGTSAGAPTFAGILALINQATSSNGLGNVNPMLYSLAASSSNAFHDVTSGDNKVPCTTGTKNCSSTTIGFSAGSGYDQVTGLGSLDVTNLISAWTADTGTPVGDFSLSALATGKLTAGQSGSSTVTVSALNGFTGEVDLSCASSGAQVSCSLNPTSVNLTGPTPETSTLSISASADLRMPNERPLRKLWFPAGGGIFAAIVLAGVPSRRKWSSIFMLLILGFVLIGIGCGGSSPRAVQQSKGPQSFTVTITGTGTNGSGTSLTHSTTLNLTVQ
jgi:subtilase family serine protease